MPHKHLNDQKFQVKKKKKLKEKKKLKNTKIKFKKKIIRVIKGPKKEP